MEKSPQCNRYLKLVLEIYKKVRPRLVHSPPPHPNLPPMHLLCAAPLIFHITADQVSMLMPRVAGASR